MSEGNYILQFGIPSIDRLLGTESLEKSVSEAEGQDYREYGVWNKADSKAASTISIIGPDGTGKSVLALHLASRYLARYGDAKSPHNDFCVIYASTDLSHSKAERVWTNFALDEPAERDKQLNLYNDEPVFLKIKNGVRLKRYTPTEEGSISEYISRPPSNFVAFLDLESCTSGDDWGYLSRLLASLPEPKKEGAKHLLIVDAVEGLQMMNGERDAFGEERSRRSRIAQLIRAASKQCHLVFVVEEPKSDERYPEQFVADAVLRLRSADDSPQEYLRRTIEVEKVRAQSNVRGRHAYGIRSGAGSTTWKYQNPDDRRYLIKRTDPKDATISKDATIAHVLLFPSIDSLSRQMMERKRLAGIQEQGAVAKKVGFGLDYLNNMLASNENEGEQGLPAFSVTALIGSAKTSKGRLARAFLSQSFDSLKSLLAETAAKEKALAEEVVTRREAAEEARRNALAAEAEKEGKLAKAAEAKKKQIEFLALENSLLYAKVRVAKDVLFYQEWIETARYFVHEDYSNWVEQIAPEEERHAMLEKDPVPGVAVLITTEDIHAEELTAKCYEWLYDKTPQNAQRFLKSLEQKISEGAHEKAKADKRDKASEKDYKGALDEMLPYVALKEWKEKREEIKNSPQDATSRRKYALYNKRRKKSQDEFKKLLSGLANEQEQGEILQQLQALGFAESRIVCRRLEIHNLPPSVLFHIIQEAVLEAKRILFKEDVPEQERDTDYFKKCAQIRLVIDKWANIEHLYPEVKNSPLFLPYLFFWLKREGITTVIIEDHAAGDALPASYSTTSSLASLVDHVLLTWNVRFHGRRITAISPLTSFSPGQRSLTREIVASDKALRENMDKVYIDPHLELYSNIHSGEPTPIPLRVRLFTEGKKGTEYAQNMNRLLEDIFSGVHDEGHATVSCTPEPFAENGQQRYSRLREICYLHNSALNHTVIWQVDEFWGMDIPQNKESGMYPLKDYMQSHTWDKSHGVVAPTEHTATSRIVDPYHLFQPAKETYWLDGDNEKLRREQFFDFDTLKYAKGVKGSSEPSSVDYTRVPYMWDFAFMLCRFEDWKKCEGFHLKIKIPPKKKGEEAGQAVAKSKPDYARPTVQEVWNALHKPTKENSPLRSWRYFLEACTIVAKAASTSTAQPIPAFDLSLNTPETVACLVMEVWMSEILRTIQKNVANSAQTNQDKKVQNALINVKRKMPRKKPEGAESQQEAEVDLLFLVENYWEELYKTLALLFQVLEPLQITDQGWDFTFKLREPNPKSMATRHWYKTASAVMEDYNIGKDLVPMRLPGSFSVRGDWFLAIANGSRSVRLGEHALDLMSSVRNNIHRLQTGIGLPTRKFPKSFTEEADKPEHCLETCLYTREDLDMSQPAKQQEAGTTGNSYAINHRKNLSYEELIKLGADSGVEAYWFWRSSLKHYDRNVMIWHKWLQRVFMDLDDARRSRGADWVGGFQFYDKMEDPGNTAWRNYPTFKHFEGLKEVLKVKLEMTRFKDSLEDETT